MTANPPSPCPRCGVAASGNFCATCGAPLGALRCAACDSALSDGARFCHKCGLPAGDVAPHGRERIPWIVATVLTVITIAAVVIAAGKRNTPPLPSMANAGNATTGTADDPTASGVPAGRAPPIDNLTRKEQFTRLEARITQALEKGDTATVINFTPMALGAYANLPAADRDIDARYHAAMLQAQVGMFDQAKALADTILTVSPDNLFGYYIRATVAEFSGDSAAARAARAAFRAHYDSEMKTTRPEYAEHRPFLEQYRTNDGSK